MAKAGKNTHLEHIEDEIINNGTDGGDKAIEILKYLGQFLSGEGGKKVAVTTKWDGAPAVICGTDPSDGQFFVGTKSVFAIDSKICKTERDIDGFYSGALAAKLKAALSELRGCVKGVLQGDLMFTDDKSTEDILGERFISFRPNTITYAVSPDSKLGREIDKARLGIVFHTKYTGATLATMTASFDVQETDYTVKPGVWIERAEFQDIGGVATLTTAERQKFDAAVRRAEGSLKQTRGLLDKIQSGKKTLQIDTEFKKFFNNYVKQGRDIPSVDRAYVDFFNHLAKEYEKKIKPMKRLVTQADKAFAFVEAVELITSNENAFKMIIASYMNIQYCKNLLVDKMKKVSALRLFVNMGTHYEATTPEGFVAISGRTAVKIIDRLEFSRLNFTVPKVWG
jgi:hypothetical protein